MSNSTDQPAPSQPTPFYRLHLVLAIHEVVGPIKLWQSSLPDLVRCMTRDPRVTLYADPDPELPVDQLLAIWQPQPLTTLQAIKEQEPTTERETPDGRSRWRVAHFGLLVRATEAGTDPIAIVLGQLGAFGFVQVQEHEAVLLPGV